MKRSKNVFWDKTKRLVAAIGCFGLAALFIYLITWFFEGGGGVAKVGVFLFPLIFGWYGLKNLVNFFSYLFTSKDALK